MLYLLVFLITLVWLLCLVGVCVVFGSWYLVPIIAIVVITFAVICGPDRAKKSFGVKVEYQSNPD